MSSSSPAAPAPVWVEAGTPAYRRISLALFLAGFATFSLLYCVQPLLPEFATHFGIGAAASSMALSLTTGCLAVAILLAGALSERVQRRPLMFVSMALAALCNLLAAFAPGWHSLLAARALEGLLLGGVPAVAMAYLSEEIHPRALGFAMGLYVGGTAFGGMAGRVGMSLLTDAYGWQAALAVMSVLDLLAAAGFVWLLPPSRNFVRKAGTGARHHLRTWGAHLRQPGLPLLFLVAFTLMGVFVTAFNYAGFRLTAAPYHLSQTQIGLLFCTYVLGMVASPVAGGLADRFGRQRVLLGGVLVIALGVLLTQLQPLAGFVAGIGVATAGFFVAHSVASSWVGRLARQSKGHASSLYLLAYYLGSSLLGAAGGWAWEGGRWGAVVAFALALLAVALWAALQLRHIVADEPAA